jgi:hypothetical protein
MRRGRRGELHPRVALVATEPAEVHRFDTADTAFDAGEAAGFSLLRLSVPARLSIVAAAAALLWVAVFWALA